jgi:hypothetical protein
MCLKIGKNIDFGTAPAKLPAVTQEAPGRGMAEHAG